MPICGRGNQADISAIDFGIDSSFNCIIFIQMVEYNKTQNLSDILKAASDPTRRSILTELVQQGATRVTELAAHYDMSLNSISKHIKVLEKAGLVSRKTIGRVHLIEAKLEPIQEIEAWFKNLKSIWALRLESLDALIGYDEETDDNKRDSHERTHIKH